MYMHDVMHDVSPCLWSLGVSCYQWRVMEFAPPTLPGQWYSSFSFQQLSPITCLSTLLTCQWVHPIARHSSSFLANPSPTTDEMVQRRLFTYILPFLDQDYLLKEFNTRYIVLHTHLYWPTHLHFVNDEIRSKNVVHFLGLTSLEFFSPCCFSWGRKSNHHDHLIKSKRIFNRYILS